MLAVTPFANRSPGHLRVVWTLVVIALLQVLSVSSSFAQKATSERDSAWRRANELLTQGDADVVRGDTGAALNKYRSALDTFKRLSADEPGNRALQQNLGLSHTKIGDIQTAQGDLGAALTGYKASLTIFERLAASDPKNADWQRDLSVSYDRIGDIQTAQGDLGAALTSYKASLTIRERLAASDPKNAGWQRDLSVSHNKIGDIQKAQGDLGAALVSYTNAINADPKYASAYISRSSLYQIQGDYDQAIADAVKAVELAPKAGGYVRSLGLARFNKGTFKEAAADLLRSLELSDDSYAMLFRYLARQRAGDNAVAELEANAGRLKDKKWPYAVIELYLGKRSPEATLDAAGKPDEKCEAQFYIGQWQIAKGDPAAAAAPLKVAVDTCPKTFIEYVGAVVELKRLKP
jgi:tetratricopeptide (TPR) repeat protein